MKLKNYLLLAGAGLMLASCSQEDVFNPGLAEGEANVSFTIDVPSDLGTRTFGDGTTANKLQYSLYKKLSDGSYERIELKDYTTYYYDTDQSKYVNEAIDFSLSHTLNFQLLNGETYRLIAFADKLGWVSNGARLHGLKFSTTGATIENKASGTSSISDEAGDMFWGCEEFTVNGDMSGVIPMKRPVAQINIGTNDYEVAEALGFQGISSSYIQMPDYGNLDLVTGNATTAFNSPGRSYTSKAYEKKDTEDFPVKGYKYMAIYYPLVGDDQELFDIVFSYTPKGKTAQKRTIASVPVQRNHRTNIYGSILTSNLDLTVEIEPMFDEPAYDGSLQAALAFGGTYRFNEDYTIDGHMTVSADAILDLNGHTVTVSIPNDPSGSQTTTEKYTPIFVQSGAHLTVKGDAEGSTLTSAKGQSPRVIWVSGGEVTIESGLYTTENTGELLYIDNKGGTINIKGGTFKNGNSKNDSQNFLLNCYDAAYKDGTAKFVITGGTFYNFDPSDSKVDINPNAKWIPDGYRVISYEEGDDMVYTVVPENTIEVSEANNFATAINAINASSDKEVTVFVTTGEFPTKSGNATFTEWPSNKTINFIGQGKGKSIITQMDYFNANGSTVNFKDLTLKVTENSTNHTALGLKGVKESSFENVDIYGEYHIFDGDATFKNCNFYFAGGGTNQTRYAIYEESDGKVLVEDCVFDTSCKTDDNRETKGILVYSTVHDNLGDLTVNNCKFIVTGANSTKAAIEIHSEKFLSAGTIKINNVTGDIDKYNEGLWREVNGSTPTKFFEVWVNGEKKQDREDSKN